MKSNLKNSQDSMNKVTTEQLKQFWNHSIHPITGLKANKSDFYSHSERAERTTNNKLKKKYNKE